MADQISDMLSRIRNATSGRQTRVDVPLSRVKSEIARILQSEGYIQGFKVVELPTQRATHPEKMIRIFLKYGPVASGCCRGWSGSVGRVAECISGATRRLPCSQGWGRASSRRPKGS